jgi:hypothetical protein
MIWFAVIGAAFAAGYWLMNTVDECDEQEWEA